MNTYRTPGLMVAIASMVGATLSVAHADPFTVTYENPGVEATTSAFNYVGVETFDERPTGTGENFTTNFGTTAASAYQFTGTYSGVQISAANLYGAAGGTGNYAVTYGTAGYSLGLSAVNTATKQAAPVDYFGFWLSALDPGNQVSFYNGSSLVYSFSPQQVLGLVSSNSAYYGNPNAAFQGQDGSEPFVFLNFYDTAGSFNRVVFAENPTVGGYESDNQTIGYFSGQSGTNVPEPADSAVMVAGLAALAFLRWRIRA